MKIRMRAPAPPLVSKALAWSRTPRLAMREFALHDVDDLVAMHREPRLREYLVDDYPLHVASVARLFVERLGELYRRHEGYGIWQSSALEPEPRFAGWFSLMWSEHLPGEVEIGARLLPRCWGSGLALEGAECLLEHAFEDLHHGQVWGCCHPGNRSARAALLALGFEAVGLGPYDRGTALWHRIDLNAWRSVRNIPRGTRLRRALRALGADAAAAPARHEEPAHAHDRPEETRLR